MATVDEGVWLPWEWKDDLDDYTPITAERLNHMNDGIKRACDSLSLTPPTYAMSTGLYESESGVKTANITLHFSGDPLYRRIDIRFRDNGKMMWEFIKHDGTGVGFDVH